MSIKIFMYDNNTGRDIPSKVGSFPVDMVLGSTVSEIHNTVTECQLFCVFTPIADSDFVVPTKDDQDILTRALGFGNYDYSVSVKESSIWYSDKAEKNIVISNKVGLSDVKLSTLLMIYLNEIEAKKRAEGKIKKSEVYFVCNTRNGNEIIRTPSMDEAISVCDKHPCSAVLNRKEEIVYRSSFGKVAVPYNSKTHTAQHKAKYAINNGVFRFKNK